MSPPVDLARLAAQALAKGSPDAPGVLAGVDARTLELVGEAIRARRRARRTRWTVGGLAGAVAVTLAVGISTRHPAPLAAAPREMSPVAPIAVTPAVNTVSTIDSVIGSAEMERRGVRSALARGAAVAVGDELFVSRAAEAALSLPTGTHITVEEGGDLAVVETGEQQIFRLTAGAVRATVHKLATGERFLVRTSDAEVEVRGTSFRVAMAAADDPCAPGVTTRVQVYEGVVTVRKGSNEARVRAGEAWPPECAVPRTPPVPTSTQASPSSAPPPSPTRSQLAEENDLYARAVTLRDRGEATKATALFERLVARYPGGPLAENGAVERMRLLGATGGADAAQAAADYLAKYPSGFARKDAEAILAREGTPR